RRDQLLGVGPGAVLEPRRERVRTMEHVLADGDLAATRLQAALPDGARLTCGHHAPPDVPAVTSATAARMLSIPSCLRSWGVRNDSTQILRANVSPSIVPVR